jgi:hypothetical protein
VTLVEAVLWRRLDEPAFEHSRVMALPQGFVLEGRVLMVVDRAPAEAHYSVHCGPDWITRHAHVEVIQGLTTRRLHVRRDERERWWADDRPIPGVDGVQDVDLAFTPCTNTLPIRRMTLAIGESRPSDAVWVRFPELTCERLLQRYTRVDGLLYRYESNGGGFAADIHVDDHGVVTRYGDLWERVAR